MGDGRREVDVPESQALLDGDGVDVNHGGGEYGGAHGKEGKEGSYLNHFERLEGKLSLLFEMRIVEGVDGC